MKKQVLLLFCLLSLAASAQTVISVAQRGITKARTGVERYNLLLAVHQEAVATGSVVDYSGIDTLVIDIPKGAASIPLTAMSDFAGVVLCVKNTEADIPLFQLVSKGEKIEVSKKQIDSGRYRGVAALQNSEGILVITDKTPWSKRIGYTYSAIRKDVVLQRRGRAQSSVIYSYQGRDSQPACTYIPCSGEGVVFQNLQFIRIAGSSYKTYLCNIDGQRNVRLSNIRVVTPESGLDSDRCIAISNSYGVTLEDISINGTYSQLDHYGYGFYLDNVSDLKCRRLTAEAKWGVFGSNNVNGALLEQCDINRFDIHCYGRDVTSVGCTFRGMYNQFSSVFGKVLFRDCRFEDSTPFLNENSYNAYVSHSVELENCLYVVTSKHHALVDLMSFRIENNARTELSRKFLPSIKVRGLRIENPEGIPAFDVFRDYKQLIPPRSMQIVSGKVFSFDVESQELQ